MTEKYWKIYVPTYVCRSDAVTLKSNFISEIEPWTISPSWYWEKKIRIIEVPLSGNRRRQFPSTSFQPTVFDSRSIMSKKQTKAARNIVEMVGSLFFFLQILLLNLRRRTQQLKPWQLQSSEQNEHPFRYKLPSITKSGELCSSWILLDMDFIKFLTIWNVKWHIILENLLVWLSECGSVLSSCNRQFLKSKDINAIRS